MELAEELVVLLSAILLSECELGTVAVVQVKVDGDDGAVDESDGMETGSARSFGSSAANRLAAVVTRTVMDLGAGAS
jgi:hypothetical protein